MHCAGAGLTGMDLHLHNDATLSSNSSNNVNYGSDNINCSSIDSINGNVGNNIINNINNNNNIPNSGNRTITSPSSHHPYTPLPPLPSSNPHAGSYAHWLDMNAYDHNPMPDYGNYGYMPPVAHSLPSPDSMSRMPPPPPLQPIQPHQHHQPHHQLPMLIMPSHATWPSMLTNPQSYSAPPISSLPMPTVGAKARLPGMGQSQPRRTLTDDDRRRMCQYHEDNPTVKQTEIGAMFGVERSTVSKVLRNKEKYLFPEDRNNSPIKRNKGKFPDIERALASWARKAQSSGADLSDSEIWEKARHFARGVGGNTEGHLKTLSTSWLEKFKQKNGIGTPGGRLLRRASEANIISASRASALSPSLTPASPISGPSPLSASRSDDGLKDHMSFIGFDHSNYRHANSQSTTSLSSAGGAFPPDNATASSFAAGDTMSPGATFTFSPDPNSGSFLSGDPGRGMPHGAFQRPRSQTFPTLDLEYLNQSGAGSGGDAMTPKYPPGNDNAIASDLDSPDHEHPPSHASFPIDTALSSPAPLLHHSRSSGSLRGGRTAAAPISTANILPSNASSGSSPTSPTQEDARRAANTLLNFFQSLGSNGQLFDQNEYMTVVRLTEKLRLHTHGPPSATSTVPPSEPHSIGGLSRIPEGENEILTSSLTPAKTEVSMSG